jgi:hypothetical protein
MRIVVKEADRLNKLLGDFLQLCPSRAPGPSATDPAVGAG